jgi:hypothetical protein
MKETAVEWLLNEIDMQYPEINVRRKEWMVDKAKEMHKEQIIDARIDGDENYTLVGNKRKEYAEQYYNETYKINKL